MGRNLAIVLTPPGSAAIAVMRLKGPLVRAFLTTRFSESVRRARCIYGNLTDGSRVIDDAVVVLCDDQTADVNLHGGTWVVNSALELARRHGFEVCGISAGPLPAAAVDAHSELQREVVAHLPLARTEAGVRLLLAQERAWERLKRHADFDSLRSQLRGIIDDATLRHLLHPPTVAIVGAANVGKSTLANQLFAQERSITADVPGTTRDWVGEIANINGLPVMLVDTPGVRVTDDPIERQAIRQSREPLERADLILLVLDGSRPLDPEQSPLLKEFSQATRIINKSDLRPACDTSAIGGLAISATSGAGIDDLRRSIVGWLCGDEDIPCDRPCCWTPRQEQIIERAVHDPTALQEL